MALPCFSVAARNIHLTINAASTHSWYGEDSKFPIPATPKRQPVTGDQAASDATDWEAVSLSSFLENCALTFATKRRLYQ